MKPLSPADCAHLQAADGWLDLGNHFEANAELERILPVKPCIPIESSISIENCGLGPIA